MTERPPAWAIWEAWKDASDLDTAADIRSEAERIWRGHSRPPAEPQP